MSYPRQAFLISKEHNYHLQCVSYIFIYFKQFSFKISANFSLWLDMEIIDHCSTSQNVRPLLQCTSLPLPSCPSLPSSSWQGQSGQPPWWCWPAAGWGWSGEGCRPWTSGLSKDLSKIPHGFLANRSNICHSWFSLNSLFFETPCMFLGEMTDWLLPMTRKRARGSRIADLFSYTPKELMWHNFCEQ